MLATLTDFHPCLAVFSCSVNGAHSPFIQISTVYKIVAIGFVRVSVCALVILWLDFVCNKRQVHCDSTPSGLQ